MQDYVHIEAGEFFLYFPPLSPFHRSFESQPFFLNGTHAHMYHRAIHIWDSVSDQESRYIHIATFFTVLDP